MDTAHCHNSGSVALFKEGAAEQSLKVGDEGYLVLDTTPFTQRVGTGG